MAVACALSAVVFASVAVSFAFFAIWATLLTACTTSAEVAKPAVVPVGVAACPVVASEVIVWVTTL
ncbi:Uncharacterised protein [Actinobacillus equuli]|nr:Uncharacterised protein [Actinobacillus equuli]